jgi:16S rRNA (cytosine1402-N4)-methyltransferase
MHQPVLLNEVIENLRINPDGIYIDATFGRGGHSSEILKRLSAKGRLLVIDKDLAAIEVASKLQDERVIVKHGSFSLLKNFVFELGLIGKISGILLDLGVSSPQLDEGERGFSFLKDGPLDMRMDKTQKLTAEEVVNNVKEADLANIFVEYGEERFSKRIAKAIVKARENAPITTTLGLSEIVCKAHPKWEKTKHPATRVFQALRIFVNQELEELKSCLEQCLEVLEVHGRLLVISFHSLEDKLVKQFLRKHVEGDNFPIGVPVTADQLNIRLKSVERVVRANISELSCNPRSRSAALRVMEKVA